MWGPGCPVVWFLVDEKVGARWCHRVCGEIILSEDLGIGGELGVDAGCPQEVKGDDRLGNEFIPQVHWECRVSGGQTGYEVIFEGAYGTFCGVGSVYAWGYKLILDILCIHISFQNGGEFVVHSLKFGT
jgi:hypothetical protein